MAAGDSERAEARRLFEEMNMEQSGFFQDDFIEVVDVFRTLKKWRDEKHTAERQALLLSNADLIQIQ